MTERTETARRPADRPEDAAVERRPWVEPAVSAPKDVLEATTLFLQGTPVTTSTLP